MSEQEGRAGLRRPRYTAEFEADAVGMVIEGVSSIAEVARRLGLVESTLSNWVRQVRIDRGERAGLTTDEWAGLVRLRRENARLDHGA